MELRHLRHYVALAETLSFTDAARMLGMSQPALSSSIRVLEDELGATLLDRRSRRAALTAVGERLLPEVRQLLGLAETLPGLARASSTDIVGTVTLGLVQALDRIDLAGVLRQIRSTHPGVDFRVMQETTQRMREQLRDRTLDLAFLYDSGDEIADLRRRPLYEERLVVIVPDDDPLAARRRIEPRELRRRCWIDFAPGTNLLKTTEAFGRRHHLHRDVVAQVGQLGVLVELVRSGLGIAIVPEVISGAAGTVTLDVVGQPLRRNLVLAHRAESLGPTAELVAHHIVAAMTGADDTSQLPSASHSRSGARRGGSRG